MKQRFSSEVQRGGQKVCGRGGKEEGGATELRKRQRNGPGSVKKENRHALATRQSNSVGTNKT